MILLTKRCWCRFSWVLYILATTHQWWPHVVHVLAQGTTSVLRELMPQSGQMLLEAIQHLTAAPWWAVIIGASLTLRLILSPFQVKALRCSAISQKVSPILRFVVFWPHVYKIDKRAWNGNRANKPEELLVYLWNKVQANGSYPRYEDTHPQELTLQELYAKHGLHPLSSLKYTLPQAPIYVLLFFSVRDMCFDPVFSQSMAFGGTLWFTDLTAV